MSERTRLSIALTIAGSDSGGGAGIQADLKTFAAFGVHGTSAITCVTAQNPKRVMGIQAIAPGMVRRQIEAVFAELPPAAVKTGMLYSAEIIRVVVQLLRRGEHPPLVVDPVMVSTSGARLLKASAIKLLKAQLLPLATLVTPNLPEAEILVGRRLSSVQDLHKAARELGEQCGCAVLIKGGHFRHPTAAMDVLYDGDRERMLVAPWVRGVATHGAGCTYSAAIAAGLTRGYNLLNAIESAKRYVTNAIEESRLIGRHPVLHFSTTSQFGAPRSF